MKLSDAIRLGSMLKPQGFGGLRDHVGTCALGAAEDAVGMIWWVKFGSHPALMATCPACGDATTYDSNLNTVAHLNDDHRWTREQIADWVATIEPADAPAQAEIETTVEVVAK